MEWNEDQVKKCIAAVIQMMQKDQLSKETRPVYLVFDRPFPGLDLFITQALSFWETVTAVIPDEWGQQYPCFWKDKSPSLRISLWHESNALPLEDSLTIYPVMTHTWAAKMALCIGDSFITQWGERCIQVGAAVHFILAGLQKFTGQEPCTYKEMIFSYYRQLLSYGVSIGSLVSAVEKEANNMRQEGDGNKAVIPDTIITVKDINHIPPGGCMYILPKAIVTSFAAEMIEKRGIVVIRKGW